jgi:hypothetical protein
MNNTNPPNIVGDWYYYVKVLRQETIGTKPSFDKYVTGQFPVTFEQDGDFVILSSEADPPLRPSAGYNVGYWNKVYMANGFYWQLVYPDYDDNGIYILTISEINSEGMVTKLSGVYHEGGFNSANPSQLPTVAGITFTKLSYK